MRFALIALLGFVLALSVSSAHRAESADIAGTGTGCIARTSMGAANQAGLMVKFGDGRTLTYCIEFAEDSITGLELLRRSGLSVVTASSGGIGAAVCTIDGQGCSDPGDCFCMCQGGTCAYWAYFRRQDNAWQYSPIGAGTRTIRNGDADAWIWGNGGTSPGGVTPECAAAPSATPMPTSTPLPPVPTLPPPRVEEAADTPPQPTPTATPPAVVQASGTVPPTQIPQPAAPAAGAQVLGAASTPPPLVRAATPPLGPSSTPSTATPPAVTTPTSPAGIIRVSGEQGLRNASAGSGGNGWSWRTTLTFVGVALALTASGAALYRRRRVRS